MIMVKPGMAYLDIVRDLKNQVRLTEYMQQYLNQMAWELPALS